MNHITTNSIQYSSAWSELPSELLAHIANDFEMKEVRKCRQVCKRWKQVFTDGRFMRIWEKRMVEKFGFEACIKKFELKGMVDVIKKFGLDKVLSLFLGRLIPRPYDFEIGSDQDIINFAKKLESNIERVAPGGKKIGRLFIVFGICM